MAPFAIIALFLVLTYLTVGAYTLSLNPGSWLNRVFALLCLCFAVWALGYVFAHQATDKSVYWIGYRMATPGWSACAGFILHFFLILTGRKGLLKRKWIYLVLYLPAVAFAGKNLLEGPFLASDVVMKPQGWVETSAVGSTWTWAFFSYFALYTLTGLVLCTVWGVRSRVEREKRQARIVATAGFAVVLTLIVVEFALPALGVYVLPMRSQIPVLFWVMAIAYTMYRYRLMRVTPALAADEILRTMMNALIIFDPELKVLASNPAASRLLGSASEDLAGRGIDEVMPGVAELGKETLLEKLGRRPVEGIDFSFVNRQGRELHVTLSASTIRDLNGEPIGVVAVLQDITELHRTRTQLDHLAHHDGLTDLPNRHLFRDRLDQALIRARRQRSMVGVMLLDLDKFKDVNDSLGHAVGDQLLLAVGGRLAGAIRMSDTVGRMGGDEFSFVIPDMEKPQEVTIVANRILQAFEAPFSLGESVLSVTPSIGIAIHPMDGEDGETLLKSSDIAMYRAKRAGGNTYIFFADSLSIIAEERKSLEKDLREALRRGEFTVHYQPQVSVPTRRIIGAEALVRWNHPTLGMLPPLKFLPLAEETGLILSLGEWVLMNACAQVKRWQEEGLPPIRVSVNLSLREFRDGRLEDTISRALRESGLDPRWLELEVAEETAIKDVEKTVRTMERLRELGVRVAIDEFGSGLASVMYMKKLPIDTLKIGRAFIRDVTQDLNNATIVASITSMAHGFNLEVVVAEGMETAEQFEFLRSIKCDVVQGFFFSKPLPHDELREILVKHRDPAFQL
jgi:diguanylate cyclase (GGDEF)-like protein/PAS domain S-box-containing protein